MPLGSRSLLARRVAIDMQHFTWFDLSNRGIYLPEEGPIEFHLVLGDMDDHNPETENPEILLVLKSLVNSHQNVEPVLKQRNQIFILEPMPAEIRGRLNFMSVKTF
jgi:hypothetical protein